MPAGMRPIGVEVPVRTCATGAHRAVAADGTDEVDAVGQGRAGLPVAGVLDRRLADDRLVPLAVGERRCSCTSARTASTSSNLLGLRMTATRFRGGVGASSACPGRNDERDGRFEEACRPGERPDEVATTTTAAEDQEDGEDRDDHGPGVGHVRDRTPRCRAVTARSLRPPTLRP